MITTPFKSVLHGVARRFGLDPRRNLQQDQADALAGYISIRAQDAWLDYAWPEICPTEERVFRPEWNAATVYSNGQEVWDPVSRAYYRSLCDDNVGNPVNAADDSEGGLFVDIPGSEDYVESTFWQRTEQLERVVLLDQPSKTPIGDVLEVYRENPALRKNPPTLDYKISDMGVQFPSRGTPNVVWIQFRLRPPVFTARIWEAKAAYAPGEAVHYVVKGECYVANMATAAGESPDTAPAKWDFQPLLAIFASFVELAAYADALEEDGETDKAGIINNRANDRLAAAQDRINVQQRQTAHFSVRTA